LSVSFLVEIVYRIVPYANILLA